MASDAEQLARAREYIKQKQYKDARRILKKIDDPKADEWLARIDEIEPAQRGRSGGRRRIRGLDVALVLLILAGLGFLGVYFLVPDLLSPAGDAPDGDSASAAPTTLTLAAEVAAGGTLTLTYPLNWFIIDTGAAEATDEIRLTNDVRFLNPDDAPETFEPGSLLLSVSIATPQTIADLPRTRVAAEDVTLEVAAAAARTRLADQRLTASDPEPVTINGLPAAQIAVTDDGFEARTLVIDLGEAYAITTETAAVGELPVAQTITQPIITSILYEPPVILRAGGVALTAEFIAESAAGATLTVFHPEGWDARADVIPEETPAIRLATTSNYLTLNPADQRDLQSGELFVTLTSVEKASLETVLTPDAFLDTYIDAEIAPQGFLMTVPTSLPINGFSAAAAESRTDDLLVLVIDRGDHFTLVSAQSFPGEIEGYRALIDGIATNSVYVG
ncbi:MAG: hypothetical protein GYB67_02260 [Chloroflexi bacterium]|nr:hypothetical protein [Chloroflexota bacterium]